MSDSRRIEIEEDYGLAAGATFEPVVDLDDVFDLTSPHVMTVLGPVEPAALGVTLHRTMVMSRPAATGDHDPDRVLDDPHASLAEVEDFHAAGGGAIVDGGTASTGRDAAGLLWIAARAPAHLIASTGIGAGGSADRTIEYAIGELRDGIDGSTERAGMIRLEADTDADSQAGDVRARAASAIHRATGAPIHLVSHSPSGTLQAIDRLRAEGVAPDRLVATLSAETTDDRGFQSILETGAFCSLTATLNNTSALVERLTRHIQTSVELGCADQMLVSLDFGRRTRLRAYGGEPGWVFMLERFTLMLMEAGLDAMAVQQLLISNPQRALTILKETTK